MKLLGNVRCHLKYYLKQLEKKHADKLVIETLQKILDTNKTVDDVRKEIYQLQHLANGVPELENEAPLSLHPGLDACCVLGIFFINRSRLTSAGSIEGIKMLRKAAKYKHETALFTLGNCYEHGRGVAADLTKAAELYRQAAALDYAPAEVALGSCFELGHGVVQNPRAAIKLYETAAKKDYALAISFLGRCFHRGFGVTKDLKHAVHLFQLAAEQNCSIAISNLGACFLNGLGVDKDIERAFKLFQEAVELGSISALHNLGVCYYEGLSVPKDLKRAMELFERAAKEGDIDAQLQLGVCYEQGRGVIKDDKRAVELYQAAANQNDAAAQCMLGVRYHLGSIVPKDYELAAKFYQMSAEQNHTEALFHLGLCYWSGTGVTRDLRRAVELFQQAVERGFRNANHTLAITYRDGHCFNPDYRRAILLFQNAVVLGYEQSKRDLTSLLESNWHIFIPSLTEALSYYGEMNDYSRLGFCYQFGLGTDKNLKQAIELYKKAIELEGFPCLWDLYSCYKSLHESLPEETFQDFYQNLAKFCKSEKSEIRQEALHVQAYLYENGAPYFPQNLFFALKHYQLAHQFAKLEQARIESATKLEAYEFLPSFNMKLQEFFPFNEAMTAIIAEYAYEKPIIQPPRS